MDDWSSPERRNTNPEDAIEVAAIFGGTVVDVRHLARTGGTAPRRGRVALAIAGALLVTSLGAFAYGVRTAARDERAQEAWLAAGHPAHDFRPERLSPIADWLAFGGLAGALVAIGVGLALLRAPRTALSYRIGRGDDADFTSQDAPSEPLAIVRSRGHRVIIAFSRGMTGELASGERTYTLEELVQAGVAVPAPERADVWEVPLGGGSARLRAGRSTFTVRPVAPPRRQPVALLAGVETRVLAFVAGSALAHLGLVALLRTLPPDSHVLITSLGSDLGRITRVESKASEEDAPEPVVGDAGDPGAEGGAPSPGAAGAIGTPQGDERARRLQVKRTSDAPALTRAEALAAAREAGMLAHLSHSGFRSFDERGPLSGFDETDVEGDFIGGGDGLPRGTFGNFIHGDGPGGGGPDWGTIASDRYCVTDGRGPDRCRLPGDGGPGGDGPGGPGGPGKLPGRDSKVPVVADKKPEVDDPSIDPELIRRRIKRQLPRIRHCYERELFASPDLDGTVTAVFVISGTGAVVASTAHGMDHQPLERCVADVIATIQFPRLGGTGSAKVSYPFHFRQARR